MLRRSKLEVTTLVLCHLQTSALKVCMTFIQEGAQLALESSGRSEAIWIVTRTQDVSGVAGRFLTASGWRKVLAEVGGGRKGRKLAALFGFAGALSSDLHAMTGCIGLIERIFHRLWEDPIFCYPYIAPI